MGVIVKQQTKTIILSPETVTAIEKILTLGNDAKVKTGKGGVTVYEEKVKKAYSQP